LHFQGIQIIFPYFSSSKYIGVSFVMMTQLYGANNVMGIYTAKDVLKNVTWMQVNTIRFSFFPLHAVLAVEKRKPLP